MTEAWDQSEIERLISDQIEESLTLEYKGKESLGKKDSDKKEISKDVSAMANSGGGILIYGVSEYDESGRKHLPKEIEPIDRQEFSRLDDTAKGPSHPRLRLRATSAHKGAPACMGAGAGAGGIGIGTVAGIFRCGAALCQGNFNFSPRKWVK